MMFANIDSTKRKITLISIPRDLYYNSRKLNAVCEFFGIEELKRTISNLTGYKVDKYVMIDMYAFIDVIDMIGGVDVHLDQPVIDPTYKVFDGGQWSTLYYKAGDYHLSGKQALRLARTRHTSSDFARADRQQMIIQSLQKKAKSFGFGDASKLNEIGKYVLSKIETDISLTDALSFYFRYQNFDIDKGNVISSGNILDSKYTGDITKAESGCASKPSKTVIKNGQTQQQDACAGIDKGQFILVPKNNNWNILRWYFHTILEG